jgi:hypothetical protein
VASGQSPPRCEAEPSGNLFLPSVEGREGEVLAVRREEQGAREVPQVRPLQVAGSRDSRNLLRAPRFRATGRKVSVGLCPRLSYKRLSPGVDDRLYVRYYIKYPTSGRYHPGTTILGSG